MIAKIKKNQNPHFLLVHATLENTWQFLKKWKLPHDPAIPLLGIYKNNENTGPHKNLYMDVYSRITHHSQKVETTQMSINWGWIKKTWRIYILEYYSAIKKSKVLIHNTTWMNFDNMLSERKQTTKSHILFDSIYMKCPEQKNPK